MFDDDFNFGSFIDDIFSSSTHQLRADLYDDGNNYIIEMELPGLSKEDIKVEYDNNYLVVDAISNKEEEDKNYIKRERYYRDYSRRFYLVNIDSDNIKANYKDGLLKLNVPKIEGTSEKKIIEIKEK